MRAEYDFSKGKRGAVIPQRGKTRISIFIDNTVLAHVANFYEEVLGFEHGLLDAERRWLFLWVNGKAGMVVLQEDPGPWPQQHFAFAVAASDLDRLKSTLEQHGISVQGPVELSWMEPRSLYFADPEGRALEFCAVLAAHRSVNRA